MRRSVAALVTAAGVALLVAGCSAQAAGPRGSDGVQSGAGGVVAAAGVLDATVSNTVRLGLVAGVDDGSALVGVRDNLFREDLGAGVPFQPVRFASSAAAESALVQGRLQAAYLSPVSAVAAWQATRGGIKVVSGAASARGQSSVVLVVTTRFLASQSVKVQGLLKGQLQASQLLATEPVVAWRMAAAELTALGQRTSAPQFAREAGKLRFTSDLAQTSVLAQARHAAAARTVKPVSSLASMYELEPVDLLLRAATFGSSLDFTRTDDAQAAEQQTRAGTPAPLGYGRTDDWASSLSSASAVPGDIYTIDGLRTSNVLDGPPTSEALDQPAAVVRNAGNTYIADTGENRVLEVAGSTGVQWGISMTAGDEYVIAGSPSGVAGSTTSGHPIAGSELNAPAGLATNAAGDLFIADSGNNRVLEIPVSSGTSYGISMTADDMYRIAGRSGGSAGDGGDGEKAVSGFLDVPTGLAVAPSGDLYIADTANSRVQEVFEGGQDWGQSGETDNDIYTVTGSASGAVGASANGTAASGALLNFPEGVSLSSTGGLYVADTGNNRIVEVPQSSGTQWGISMTADDLYTVAGSAAGAAGSSGNGGAARSARLFEPTTVEADNGQQLYIADSGNNVIREVARTAHTERGQSMTADDIYAIAGTGTAGISGDGSGALSARLNDPEGFGIDGSVNLYIADTGNNRVREVSSASGDITEFAGDNGNTLATTGDGGPATGASLGNPLGVTADAQGDLFIADGGNNRVQEIAASAHEQFGISMTAGDTYTVAGSAAGNSGESGNGVAAVRALLDDPVAVAVDGSGNLYIADINNNRVVEVAATSHTQDGIPMAAGDFYTVAGSATGQNSGDSGDGGPAAQALLEDPSGVAVDKAGDLFISDQINSRIQEVPAAAGTQYGISMTAGDMYTIAGSASGTFGTSGDGGRGSAALLADPFGIVVDSAGNVLIADSGNNRVQELAATAHAQFGQQMKSGDIYTVAGSAAGTVGDSGDRAPAASARLDAPAGAAIDAAGDLYVADTANNQVREVAAASGTHWAQQMKSGDIYTVAGSTAGTAGNSGTGGSAGAALLDFPIDVGTDPAGDVFIPDLDSDTVLEAVTTATPAFPVAQPGASITVTQPGASITVTQPVAAEVTFLRSRGDERQAQ